MKPISIEMKAFGSYRDETISFENTNHGLFLITGDTGAGKTTIFDAISYALFEKTSGGNRDGAMMRSQYAPNEIKTEVTFCFSYDGQVYTVRRWPIQPKYKKIKEKDRYEKLKGDLAAGVELIMPNGKEFVGSKKEIDEKIKTIIGLDASQFTQIAMLAQGDFMKLLLASSNERKDIFAKIFDTRVYEQIQYELERRWNKSFGQLEENKKDIKRELERIKYIENSEYQQQWEVRAEKEFFTETEKEELLELLENICREAEKSQKEIRENKEKIDAQIAEILGKIQQAESINQLFEQLESCSEENCQLKLKKEEIQTKKQRAEKGERALLVQKDYETLQEKKQAFSASERKIAELFKWLEENKVILSNLQKDAEKAKESYDTQSPMLVKEINKIEETLESYDVLQDNMKKYQQADKELQQLKQEIDTLLKNKTALEKEQSRLSEETQELKEKLDNTDTLNAEKELLQHRENSLKNILDNEKKLEKLQTELTQKEEVYQQAKAVTENCQQEYDRIYKEFIHNQADILRSQLKEGEPCPVCGNVHYNLKEIPAAHIENIVDDAMVENAKGNLENAKKAEENAACIRQEKAGEKENIFSVLNSECRNIFGSDYEESRDNIEEEYNITVEKLSEVAQRKERTETSRVIIAENEKKISTLNISLEENETKRKACEDRCNTLKLEQKGYETAIKEQQKHLSYDSRESAIKERDSKKEILSKLEGDYRNRHNAYLAAEKEMDTKTGAYATEKENRNVRAAELTKAETEYAESLMKNGFSDTDSFRKALISQEEITDLKNQVADYNNRIAVVKDNLKRLTKETEGKQKADTKELKNKKEALSEQKEELDAWGEKVYNIVAVDREVCKKVKKLYREREEINEENQLITSLYKTANGKYSGKKINFQTYIQRRYFKQVIERANKRLYKMSNNQFILRCREMEDLGKSGYVGLDLDVYSIVNDQIRDVKTLSGGESFVAALSMALGMADIIQDSHGSVHIDTMFIDEGFGSLSDETRNQAIGILNELSEGKRLVGIISHVSELKAQVETKLVVSKTDSGSSTHWEY